MDASGGKIGLGVSPWTLLREALREWLELEDVGDLLSAEGEAGPLRWAGSVLTVEKEEEELRKDCSKGLGSRSRLLRRGRGGGRLSCWSGAARAAAESGGEGSSRGGEESCTADCTTGCTWVAVAMTEGGSEGWRRWNRVQLQKRR